MAKLRLNMLAPSCTRRRDGTASSAPSCGSSSWAAVDEAMERLVRLAKHLGAPPDIDPALGIKRVFVKRFLELPTRFRVLAVAHGRRRPFYWGNRL